MVDNGFLVSLLIVSMRHFGLHIFDRFDMICKLTVFLNYTFSFLSSWFVVIFSCERFLIIARPFENLADNETIKLKTKIALALLIPFSAFFYSHLILTSGIEEYSTNSSAVIEHCVTLEKWLELVRFSALVDSFIAIIGPLLIIAVMNCLLAVKLVQLSRDLHSSSYTFSYSTCIYKLNDESSITRANNQDIETSIASMLSKTQKRTRLNNYIKSIKSLFLVTVSFLLLNTPIAICKIRYSVQAIHSMIASFMITKEFESDDGEMAASAYFYDELAERITCYIYYLNFCLNFIIYFLKIKKFKKKIPKEFYSISYDNSSLKQRNKYGKFNQTKSTALQSDSLSLKTF
jgi:hypothetical protein